MPKTVFLDFETWSRTNLRKTGAHKYAQSPDLKVLLATWAVDDGPVKLANPHLPLGRCTTGGSCMSGDSEGLEEGTHSIEELYADCSDADWVVAHNAGFDRAIWKYGLRAPFDPNWRCTMLASLAMGLPGGLGDIGEFFNFGKKNKAGQKMMRLTTKMREPPHTVSSFTSKMREDFAEYAKQDTVLLRQIYTCPPIAYFFQQPELVELCECVMQMNEKGVGIDQGFINSIQPALSQVQAEAEEELSEMTEGTVTTPFQYARQAEWLQYLGAEVDGADKTTLVRCLSHDNPSVAVFAQTLLDVRNSSKAKFAAALECRCLDGTAKDSMRAFGAHTHRWSSKHLQIQNAPRGVINSKEQAIEMRERAKQGGQFGFHKMAEDLDCHPNDVAKSMVRMMLVPEGDGTFISLDYAQIELRCLSWLSGQDDVLTLLRNDSDVYMHTAAAIYGVELHEVTKDMRYVGKQTELASGYGMGGGKFEEQCAGYGLFVDPTALGLAEGDNPYDYMVNVYRRTHPKVVAMWAEARQAMENAQELNQASEIGTRKNLKVQKFDHAGWPLLRLTMPSGSRRHYWNFGRSYSEQGGTMRFRYDSFDPKEPVASLYGGKLVHNATQAMAAELLNRAILRMWREGIDVRFMIHDEVIIECSHHEADNIQRVATEIMLDLPEWADGLPLAVDANQIPFYAKV